MSENLPGDSEESRQLRDDMVCSQLRGRGLRDAAVLDAFRAVPRHLFCVAGTRLQAAYADHPLAIGDGQTISQPYMVAEMTAQLELKTSDRVLEIGTGSGYQAAILACLVGEVHTVERIPALAEEAVERLKALGYSNVSVHEGDGTLGWPENVPYDAIIVTAASPGVPEPLKEQLRDGGRLAIPVGGRYTQQLAVWKRSGDSFESRDWGGCRFVPLIGKHGWPER